ncbi:MAG: hypothetical protein GKR93_01750 [Gammaproteobacteria bacterium]|nr:hypothetical protein [Gammaproteobacteria bacterium]
MITTVNLRELSDNEIQAELSNLGDSTGWGTEYRNDVMVTMEGIVRNIMALVENHGSFPLGVSLESDYWFLLRKLSSGEYELLEHWERANFVVETDKWSGNELEKFTRQLAWPMFRNHLNGIRVIGGNDT